MNKTLLLFLLLTAALFTFVECGQTNDRVTIVDFSSKDSVDTEVSGKNPDHKFLEVAVSSMISPKETFIYYEELFDYLSEKLGRKIRLNHRLSYQEVNELLIKNEVDIAFICTGAYIKNSEDFELLVVPVCYGKPYYQAYVIVNEGSDVQTFSQLRGKTFAYTDPLSNTGKMYAEKRVQDLKDKPSAFFGKILYSGAHDISIQLVARNIVEGATIDGLIYEYMMAYFPEKVQNIRVIEKSEYFGMPPIVTSKHLPEEFRAELTDIFTNMHLDPKAKKILNSILIDRFIFVTDTLYSRSYEIAGSL